MNMEKLGIVSRSKDSLNSTQDRVNTRKDAITRYTLCEVNPSRTRNGSRYGFAFYIPRIMGSSLFRLPPLSGSGKSGVLGNTRTNCNGLHK